jgi:hypothetical protein
MASVRVDNRNDPRFAVLGLKLGTNKYDALGRMIAVWDFCTEKGSAIITDALVNVLAEHEKFSEAICDEEVGLAERVEGGIRVKGTRGRIEWLAKLRKNARKGGEKNKAKWLAKREPDGSQLPSPTAEPNESPKLCSSQLGSALLSSSQKEEIHTVRSRAPSFDLESVYRKYPRKKGKSPGLKKLKTDIKTPEDLQALEKAIVRYCQSPDVLRGYVMNFDTFARQWRDWLDEDAGTSTVKADSGIDWEKFKTEVGA